jgi:hypothetical protein
MYHLPNVTSIFQSIWWLQLATSGKKIEEVVPSMVARRNSREELFESVVDSLLIH